MVHLLMNATIDGLMFQQKKKKKKITSKR